MKIESFNIDSKINLKNKLLSNKKDFSGSFNDTYKSKTKEEIQNYINEIKKKGNRIAITQNYVDVLSYKSLIKDYLKAVVDYTYSLNKNTSFWETQYFTTVETINEKLEELTRETMNEQRESMNIASSIDNIQGLLVDIYK